MFWLSKKKKKNLLPCYLLHHVSEESDFLENMNKKISKFKPPSTLQFLNISFRSAKFLLLKGKCVRRRAASRWECCANRSTKNVRSMKKREREKNDALKRNC